MPSGFSFPPPPPPPPTGASQTPDHTYPTLRGSGRGRSRGRGNSDFGRGPISQSQYSPPAHHYPPGSYINPGFQRQPQQTPSSWAQGPPDQGLQGQKRKLGQHPDDPSGSWRGGHGSSQRGRPSYPSKQRPASRPKTDVAPSVPSFGSPLSFTPVASFTSTIATQPRLSSTTSTLRNDMVPPPPRFADSSDSDPSDDEDEESSLARLLAQQQQQDDLRFEHDGEIISLRTAADIEAWRKERATCFPRRSRIEQKAAERAARVRERRRIEWETAEAMGFRGGGHGPGARRDDASIADSGAAVESLSDVAASDARHAEEPVNESIALGLDGYDSSDDDEEYVPEEVMVRASDEPGDDDADDSDAAPEVVSSKAMPSTAPSSTIRPPPEPSPCRFYFYHGACKNGSRCRFAHVKPAAGWGLLGRHQQSKRRQGRDNDEEQRGKRTTLFQRLVEQEVAEENRLVVKAVKYLGDLGFFQIKDEQGKEGGTG